MDPASSAIHHAATGTPRPRKPSIPPVTRPNAQATGRRFIKGPICNSSPMQNPTLARLNQAVLIVQARRTLVAANRRDKRQTTRDYVKAVYAIYPTKLYKKYKTI
uniref:Uncharacterized protein n=1 Tax=Oryza barthii TaxID=65489 RepID=A0A0D3FEX2_9ORYZ